MPKKIGTESAKRAAKDMKQMASKYNVQGTALAWFTREDYPELRKLCPDIDDTYDEWLARITARLKVVEKQGVKVTKVIIRPAELEAFAKSRGVPMDSGARAALAGIIAARQSMN
jgi:hypothetical protein